MYKLINSLWLAPHSYFELKLFKKPFLKRTFCYNNKGKKKVKVFKTFKQRDFITNFSNLCFMFKFNAWEETIVSVLILGENLLLIVLSNAMMVTFFLFGINLSIFLPLNPAIYRTVNVPNILYPRCKEQDESHPNSLPPFYLLLQDFQINLD